MTLQAEREPHNMYDRNAVSILINQTTKIGHVKKDDARLLAPLMDDGVVTVQAIAKGCTYMRSYRRFDFELMRC